MATSALLGRAGRGLRGQARRLGARHGEGFRPEHDLYLSFGHNEETAGDGAQEIVSLLEQRGVTPAFVLDEGGAVVEGIFPGVDDPIAVVGVAEKGILTLTMTVDQ